MATKINPLDEIKNLYLPLFDTKEAAERFACNDDIREINKAIDRQITKLIATQTERTKS